ncbi:MAG: metallopeptidase family protein [Chloroflexi bacterium]|nr:metallopeptidase family protein [Chloroflexota bacterium]
MRIRRQEFEFLVRRAIKELPPAFRARLVGVDVVIEDAPSPELRVELGLEPGELLFGLYDGVPLTHPDRYAAPWRLPDRILLFQRTFERTCATPQEVLDEVRSTIIHEVGHHFGLSEDQLEEV